jgi:hypothetical protein
MPAQLGDDHHACSTIDTQLGGGCDHKLTCYVHFPPEGTESHLGTWKGRLSFCIATFLNVQSLPQRRRRIVP